ncbi:MAG: class I SAM-dependent methyltransferase [Nitrososphaerota archaeon]|nr:class I SAM-dependent methyltransferase [Nitrososphaerota archaeon]
MSVETGVAYGVSSMFILSALARNNYGRLVSIDREYENFTRDDGERWGAISKPKIGSFVDENLRKRRTLVVEDSRAAMPRILKESPQIDLFVHDSAHNYETMLEFETTWENVKPGGVLVSDDADWSGAFADFCESKSLEPVHIVASRVAAVVKVSK